MSSGSLVGFISESEKERGEAAVSTKGDGATHILSAPHSLAKKNGWHQQLRKHN
jgi:hypothetical protein